MSVCISYELRYGGKEKRENSVISFIAGAKTSRFIKQANDDIQRKIRFDVYPINRKQQYVKKCLNFHILAISWNNTWVKMSIYIWSFLQDGVSYILIFFFTKTWYCPHLHPQMTKMLYGTENLI